MVTVLITIEDEEFFPTYATEGSAGMDVKTPEDFFIRPGMRHLVMTGIKVAIPIGFEIQVRPRSGLALKTGITVANSPGTIDSDYRGEVGIILVNHSADEINFSKGDKIAQLVVCPVYQAELIRVEELPETERAEGGFGSTGK
jgi:dUTP pyrophosphatase